MSPQLKHDEERGITPQRCIVFSLRLMFAGLVPSGTIFKAAELIELTLKKMGFKIVPMERADFDGQ